MSSSVAARAFLRRFGRPFAALLAVLTAYALFGHFGVPALVRHYLPVMGSEALGRSVGVDAVRFHPFRLVLELDGLRVATAAGDGDALQVASIHANLELASIVQRAPVLHELRIDAPRLMLVRDEDGALSWADVIARFNSGEEGEGGRFSVGNIQLSDGALSFDDRLAGVHHRIDGLRVNLPFVSNLPVKVDVFVEPALSASVNGTPFSLAGKTRPFAERRETMLEFNVVDQQIAPYLAYLPFQPAFRVAAGELDALVELSFSHDADGSPRLAVNGELSLNGVELVGADGPLLKLEQIAVDMVDLQPLAGKWQFSRLRINSPELHLLRLADGRINLAALLLPATASAGPAGRAAAVDFLLASARLRDGVVHFEDRSTSPPLRLSASGINADLRDLANRHEVIATLRGDLLFDELTRIDFHHELRLAPLQLEGSVNVDGLRAGRLQPYYAATLKGGEVRDGVVDALLALRYTAATGGAGAVFEADLQRLQLRDLAFGLRGQTGNALALAALTVEDARIRPATRSVDLAALQLQGLQLSTVRGADGRFDLATMLPAGGGGGRGAEAPWRFTVAALSAEDGTLRYEDRGAGVRLTADQLALRIDGLSSAAGSRATIDLRSRINQRGRAAVRGQLQWQPALWADLQVDLRSVDLAPIHPYLLAGTRLALARGNLTAAGRVEVAQQGDGGLQGRFRGDLGIANLAAVERASAAELLRWRTLRVAGVDAALQPPALQVRELNVSELHAHLLLDSAGQLNLRALREGDGPAEEGSSVPVAAADDAPAAAAPRPAVAIGRIVVDRASAHFSDRFIRPHYDARITALSGELSGLSTQDGTPAQVRLEGKVDGNAALSISGTVQPFGDALTLDIAAAVKDFELSSVSAYSGRYVGYGIERGKLSAELAYRVADGQLSASNRVFLDQLVFGAPVDSPDAIKAPVLLAVALLKNRRGEIDINLPIRGTLDDPQFSVGGLVFRAIMNLLGKAITSPFSLIGSMFGAGEELSRVEFAAGLGTPDELARERLRTLASALDDRPALRLEVTGVASPTLDPEGLRRARMMDAVRALKVRELVGAGQEAPEDLAVDAAEYEQLLRRVYRAGDFPKARNLIGMVRDLPVAEMEAVILAHTAVSADELAALAQQRAQAVRNWLVEEGGVAQERVFLLAPKVEEASGEGEQAACTACVRFSLR